MADFNRRLNGIEARLPSAGQVGDRQRGEQMASEIRQCLSGFGIDSDKLFASMIEEYGEFPSTRDYFICLGQVLAERPNVKAAISAILCKYIVRAEDVDLQEPVS
jgi:hypothetical protein